MPANTPGRSNKPYITPTGLPALLSIAQVAHATGLSTRTIRRRTSDKTLRAPDRAAHNPHRTRLSAGAADPADGCGVVSPPAVLPQPQTGVSTSPKSQAQQASRRQVRRSQVNVSRWPNLPNPTADPWKVNGHPITQKRPAYQADPFLKPQRTTNSLRYAAIAAGAA
jgi:hypothetical protein